MSIFEPLCTEPIIKMMAPLVLAYGNAPLSKTLQKMLASGICMFTYASVFKSVCAISPTY